MDDGGAAGWRWVGTLLRACGRACWRREVRVRAGVTGCLCREAPGGGRSTVYITCLMESRTIDDDDDGIVAAIYPAETPTSCHPTLRMAPGLSLLHTLRLQLAAYIRASVLSVSGSSLHPATRARMHTKSHQALVLQSRLVNFSTAYTHTHLPTPPLQPPPVRPPAAPIGCLLPGSRQGLYRG